MVDKIDWKKVLEANGKGVTVRERNHVDYLIDGSQAFQAMYDAIATAFSSNGSSGYYIYLLGWWLDDTLPLTGKPGSSILELFRAASLVRNVQIRVMLYDQPGSKQNSEQIQHINELPTGAGILDDTTLPVRSSQLSEYHPLTQISRHFEPTGSHHQKVLIVKGQRGLIGFCGGIDINQDRTIAVKRSPGSPYHDVHCRIEGDAVHDLVNVFVQRWLAHPEHVKLDKEVKKGGKGPLLGLVDCTPSNTSRKTIGNSQFVGIARTYNFVGNGKQCQKEHSILEIMKNAIGASRQFIYIEDQYLVNTDAAAELKKVLPKLQHLTILIPHSAISDLPCVWMARKRFIDILRSTPEAKDKKKVRVFYRVTPGQTAFGPHSYIHAKTWIFDDELAVIGTANCNRRGWSSDGEVAAAIFDTIPQGKSGTTSFAQRLRMDLWKEHLGLKDTSKLWSAIPSANEDLWLHLPTTAQVRPYNENEGKDKKILGLIDCEFVVFDDFIDPSAEDLPPCGGTARCGDASTVAR